ncbi:hypothetical protein FJT64_026810 [Amphibalanus amphitrite]|uniref:C-type lectin domain-containing protein n=1 Tax=Amphibalanus amphitrite TaxID=1232801 RepID=A0A6A4W2P9_AMPAM|nr:hypothetical protein FJT64_026810 [Amphibalanus amphitrite]
MRWLLGAPYARNGESMSSRLLGRQSAATVARRRTRHHVAAAVFAAGRLRLAAHRRAGAEVDLQSRVRTHLRAFSFEDLPPGGDVSSSDDGGQTLSPVNACDCRRLCLANHTCRGYGSSAGTASCRLTELLPAPGSTQASSGDWLWHARHGVRRLGERCAVDDDCSLLVAGATCAGGVCGCHGTVREDGTGGCRKAGNFTDVSGRQLASGLISETSVGSITACESACAALMSCVAFDFSAKQSRCRMYAEGITNEVNSTDNVKSFVWSFSRADGTPPASYQEVGDKWLRMLPSGDRLRAADICLRDGAILLPEVTRKGLEPLRSYIEGESTSTYIWIGMEDMLEEGRYVTSDGKEATDIAWDQGQPNAHDPDDCAVINRNMVIHDANCLNHQFNALCQYVGDNLALNRTSWLTMQDRRYPARHGNDGDERTFTHTTEGVRVPTAAWTVDLSQTVQVTSILYAGRVDCCGSTLAENRNRLTEVRVGSHPTAFNSTHLARCVWLEQPFVAKGYARLFRCTVPLTGRYVRLTRAKPLLDFAELAVFGNRLPSQP